MAMDARKFRILQAIIDDYILTAIPVGSRTISKKYEMGLSSATIRNEMSDLEELGYLDQPHVSAGRVPSAKAYRLYVDQLLKSGAIRTADAQSVRAYFDSRARQMEDVIAQAARVLSGLTQYTALVMSPKGKALHIRHLQLVPVNSRSALIVIVTDGGIMRDTVVPVGADLDADALYTISRTLTERLSGHTLAEAIAIMRDAYAELRSSRQLLSGIAEFLDSVETDASKAKLALGGSSNILNFPEYSDVEKAKGFLSVLEAKDKLIRLMETHGEMAFTVRIGPETGIPELEDCSLVTATYRLGNDTHGTIGVIGPTRMQYGKVLSILSAMGKQLTDLFTQDKE
ncbi:MAG TPA: heat-inducible transcription repressor HrcA [Candidatus Limiplasma stercoravium]|mgnify:CR=1 FL=1|nr:heat-inducible transcription repressor HrcA [Candidatus Limiplasma stercoravium]